ncbi:hypothetical protein GC163_07925 [bacterium]|nr:hypothetical protein [bacterium]
MTSSELAQIELLAQIDDLLARLTRWSTASTAWQSLHQAKAVLHRVLTHVDPLRIRFDSPLVVATFGGTGVGKSSLVNALVGEEVAVVGRQRPTTTAPTIIAHPETQLDVYLFPADARIVRREARWLRDFLIVDCPDPDTSEHESVGSNLARLHELIPLCDVLLYVSTQQKYRSARVSRELAQAAEGCQLLFVQTHAETDVDIRADWRGQLEPAYQVADMFFVDSRRALTEQRQGLRPTGDFGRLLDVLLTELTAAQRVRIRQGNLFGLLSAALERSREEVEARTHKVRELQRALNEQRGQLSRQLSSRLFDELQASRGLWERRLLAEVTELWGMSPFSLVLRAWHSQASLLASLTLMRARSTAQMAVWGAMHGARWIASRQQDQTDAQRLEQAALLQVAEGDWQEARLIIEGHARSAGLTRETITAATQDLTRSVAIAEEEFWQLAQRRLDEEIAETARRQTSGGVRALYEVGFAILPAWLIYRIGKNFFYDSWWLERPLLESHFYIPALLFLALWTAGALMLFTGRLRRGMQQRVRQLAEELAQSRLPGGLFPQLDAECQSFHHDAAQLTEFQATVHVIRDEVSETTSLSQSRTPPALHTPTSAALP